MAGPRLHSKVLSRKPGHKGLVTAVRPLHGSLLNLENALIDDGLANSPETVLHCFRTLVNLFCVAHHDQPSLVPANKSVARNWIEAGPSLALLRFAICLLGCCPTPQLTGTVEMGQDTLCGHLNRNASHCGPALYSAVPHRCKDLSPQKRETSGWNHSSRF